MSEIVHNEPLQFFVDMLKVWKNFKFMRFGDGEFFCAKGNYSHHEYTPTEPIALEYRNILANLNPEHINGLQPLALTIPELQPVIPEFDWYNADVLHLASWVGTLYPFIAALRKRNVVLICNQHIAKMRKHFPDSEAIIIRDFDCYQDKAMVEDRIKSYPDDTVFLFAASIMSNPVIYNSPKINCTFIDIGSLFEPYVGLQNRSYHKEVTQEIINKNLGVTV